MGIYGLIPTPYRFEGVEKPGHECPWVFFTWGGSTEVARVGCGVVPFRSADVRGGIKGRHAAAPWPRAAIRGGP